ncbi:transcriptional regulator, BadM/Rrf2 family [Clostridium acidisoli DSM 12555]|jgi:Rrf2 family protein|uniref:Transcriptional regulator, BadM/Rrf2 family n=1 Tax=Clostridium acidisoli DSM 12555 TaxID=1121291 RepID=A0A1W1XQZ9_9CLOT|nr:Rrf2 family transcriptional regulator [Clostridium acidisoli]SMC25931.1 transcriptional regulator, BadM/Rrf2 family [Clostridium acidisoli DSM 12555]
MKISTKGRYGLKAMIDLALNSVNDSVTLKSISERQNISEGYLEQIFASLRKKGIIQGKKGSQGGYILGNSASDIYVGDILRALEGDLSVVDADENSEDRMDQCVNYNVWNKINKSINDIVDSITLEDLVMKYNTLANDVFMYYI